MSTECIDPEARDRIAELALKQEKIEGVVWGPHGENGLRSRVGALEDWKEEVCPSIEAIDGHIAACEQAEEEETEVTVAKIKAWSANWTQFLTLLGVIATALIALLK